MSPAKVPSSPDAVRSAVVLSSIPAMSPCLPGHAGSVLLTPRNDEGRVIAGKRAGFPQPAGNLFLHLGGAVRAQPAMQPGQELLIAVVGNEALGEPVGGQGHQDRSIGAVVASPAGAHEHMRVGAA